MLRRAGQYDRLRSLGERLQRMQAEALTEAGIAHRSCGDATLFDIYFTEADCVDYRSARHHDPRATRSGTRRCARMACSSRPASSTSRSR